jgi:adenylate cyclase
MERRLAAILMTDMVGYSRLMGLDEEGTIARQKAHRDEIIDPKISMHGGRVVKAIGDGLLVEFPSVVGAVKCAVEVQEQLAQHETEFPENRRIRYRMGINLGDIVIDGEDILGDGVNVAARLEALAPPGGICISRTARDQVRDKLNYGLEDWGEVSVKNVPRPVRVFRLLCAPEDAGKQLSRPVSSPSKEKPFIITATVLALAVLISGLIWTQPWRPQIEAASMSRMAYSLPEKPSLAVMPFGNLSDEPDQGFFAEGLTEDIITDISKVSGIFVIAKGSTQPYSGKSVKVKRVAEDLGVRYVLSGSVRRSGDKLRITAQLADAIKGAQIWADRYDREVKDVFAVQSEITRQVVKALAVTLKANEHDRLFQKYITNIDAYEAFIRARAAVGAPTRSNIEQGEKLFKRVIDLDPNFAGGYAGISFNYSVKARFRYGDSPDNDTRRALEFAQKAIAADKEFAWSYIALAGAYLANGNHDAAVEAARRAVAIQPNGYEANLFMGFYLNFAGHPAEAVQHLEAANTLSRIDTIRGLDFLGMAYFTNGDYAKCEETWTRRFDRLGAPDYPHAHVFLAGAQAMLNRTERAEASVRRFRHISPQFRLSSWSWINNYKLPEHRKRLYDAAIKAGIPE